MAKKIGIVVLVVALIFGVAGCSNSELEALQDDYNALQQQNASLGTQLQQVQSDLVGLQADYDVVYEARYQAGYDAGYDVGYVAGYQAGYDEAGKPPTEINGEPVISSLMTGEEVLVLVEGSKVVSYVDMEGSRIGFAGEVVNIQGRVLTISRGGDTLLLYIDEDVRISVAVREIVKGRYEMRRGAFSDIGVGMAVSMTCFLGAGMPLKIEDLRVYPQSINPPYLF